MNLLHSTKAGMSSIFTKVVSSKLEIELQNIAAKYGFAPEIYKIEGETVHMKKVDGFCLADLYTDDPMMVPDWIWNEIQRILAVLYEREGIEYVDITAEQFSSKMKEFGDGLELLFAESRELEVLIEKQLAGLKYV